MKEAEQALIFTYLRIQKSNDVNDQRAFALDWFKTYGAEMKKRLEEERDGQAAGAAKPCHQAQEPARRPQGSQ